MQNDASAKIRKINSTFRASTFSSTFIYFLLLYSTSIYFLLHRAKKNSTFKKKLNFQISICLNCVQLFLNLFQLPALPINLNNQLCSTFSWIPIPFVFLCSGWFFVEINVKNDQKCNFNVNKLIFMQHKTKYKNFKWKVTKCVKRNPLKTKNKFFFFSQDRKMKRILLLVFKSWIFCFNN